MDCKCKNKCIICKTVSGVIEVLRGMFTVLKHSIRPAITLEYPEKRPDISPRFKGRPALRVNNDGSDTCIGCMSCTKVCPCGDLIQIKTSKDENNKLSVDKFTIDIGRCIFCGNCTEVCPKKSLIMTNEFELAEYSREALVFDKKMLSLSPEESQKWLDVIEKDS